MDKSIPLYGSFINRNTDAETLAARDQFFGDCYPEVTKNPLSDSAEVNIYKRPGFDGTSSAAASYLGVTGATEWNKAASTVGVFAYLNGTTLGIYDSNDTIIGATIPGISTTPSVRLSETTINGDAYLTLIATKSADSLPHAWFLKEGDVLWTEIVSGNYPANQATPLTTVGAMEHLDGYAFIMDTRGSIWNSNLNDLVTWSALSSVTAQLFPDGGAGLARIRNTIIAIGTRSVEFFQNASNPVGSPLTRIPNATKRIGAVRSGVNSVESIKAIGDDVYFIGAPAGSVNRGVYRINGYSVDKVSNPSVDRLLQAQVSNPPYGIAGVMNLHDMKHLVLYTGSTSFALAYCIDANFWYKIRLAGSIAMGSCLAVGTRTMFNSITNRIRYSHTTTSPVFQDNGSTFTMTIQTAPLSFGDRKHYYESAELVCDTQSVAGNISISWSDDDNQTYSTPMTIDPSTGTRRITKLGSTNRDFNHKRGWKIEETINRPFRGTLLNVKYRLGLS